MNSYVRVDFVTNISITLFVRREIVIVNKHGHGSAVLWHEGVVVVNGKNEAPPST